MRSLLLSLVVLAATMLSSTRASADGLSAAETARLERGETVVRTQTIRHGDRRYVGGIVYSVFDARADDVARLLGDVQMWRRILPRTRSAHPVGRSGSDELVELTNGTAFFQATYTMRVRREGRVVRFWMDPQRRHDIEDAWGFARAEPMPDGRTLVTYGVLIDMGDGLLRDLFENRVRELALSVPDRLRDVLERNTAG